MKRIILLLAITVSVNMIACNDSSKSETTMTATADSTTFDLSKARAFVDADNEKFVEEVKKGDSTALAEHYHSEGQLLGTNSDPVLKKDIASNWGSFIRMGIKDFNLKTTDLVGNEDLLVETGTYEVEGDKNFVDKGKYVVAWKMEDGKWKIYRDIANSSMPLKPSE